MAQVLVLYNTPADAAAFDRYYFEKHIPLAKTIPGLRSYVVNAGSATLIAGGPTPYLIAELGFDTMADVQRALGTPEGQATAADLANFASGGATILAFDTKNV